MLILMLGDMVTCHSSSERGRSGLQLCALYQLMRIMRYLLFNVSRAPAGGSPPSLQRECGGEGAGQTACTTKVSLVWRKKRRRE